MKKLLLMLSCLFLLACTPEWSVFQFANGVISVSLPKEPQANQQTIELGGQAVNFESQLLNVGEQVYRLNYYQLSTQDDGEQLLRDLLLYTQKVLHLPEDATLQATHDYRLTNIITSVGKHNTIKTRVLLDKGYLVFAYVFNNSNKQFEDAERFLNSITLP